jgi:hypothetical protein
MDLSINLQDWVVLLGTVTPFLTAIAAKLNTPDWWKGLLSITWAVAAGVVNQWFDSSGGFDLGMVADNAFSIWLVHLLSWLGVSRDAARKVHEATSNLGVAPPRFRVD